MKHNLQAEGFGVRLRPVRLDDAPFIVWLRNLDYVQGRVGDSAVSTAGQQAWLENYFQRPGDFYFLVETLAGVPVGTYGIYDVLEGSGESGRYIMRPGVPAAIPCVVVAFDLAFGSMGLRQLRGRVVSTNQISLSLTRKFGFCQTHTESAGQRIGGRPVDLIHFVLEAAAWSKARERVAPLAQLAQAQVQAWKPTPPQPLFTSCTAKP